MAALSIPDGSTYCTSKIEFFRDGGSNAWKLTLRQFDGHDSHEVHVARGLGLMTDHVLGEFYDAFESFTDGLLMRVDGGIQHFEPYLA
jgi:hypothetical protein